MNSLLSSFQVMMFVEGERVDKLGLLLQMIMVKRNAQIIIFKTYMLITSTFKYVWTQTYTYTHTHTHTSD
uniref:Uncharacterized protein n=1 Tax=Octopus bimaculoides TaxID=37653 RepID=A0A0L8GVV5_OCTBM